MTEPVRPDGPWLGLDIGGANLKAAHESGATHTIPFPLWRQPTHLPFVLDDLIRRLPPANALAVTMTAELCDCFDDKAQGVHSVLDACQYAAKGRPLCVWGIDARFHTLESVRSRPNLASASNWLALAEASARHLTAGEGLLIDIGSTTTDIIALAPGRALPLGRTDTERLATGELVYAGVRRTPLCALCAELPFRGVATSLAAELFATTHDVYLMLGAVNDDPSDLETADGRPSTAEAARSRLARMVGADRHDFSPDDALTFSRAADAALLSRLASAGRRVLAATRVTPRTVVTSGSGEFLARRLARLLLPSRHHLSLAQSWGTDASTAACARSLILLAQDRSHEE